jgi:malate dehydrogenase (oxaloacetate-decarboxylating)
MSAPSVSHSITVRLELPAQPTAVSRLSSAIEGAGGVVSAVDVSASGGEADAERIVAALRGMEGVVIGRVSDRVFLAHLGGKLSV